MVSPYSCATLVAFYHPLVGYREPEVDGDHGTGWDGTNAFAVRVED